MTYCILKAGSAQRATRTRIGDFDQLFLNLLQEPGRAWTVCDVEHGHFPERVEQFQGYLITGSRASAYDEAPWVRTLLELARAVHARRLPLLGICFGHQVLAQALGGRVRPGPDGWQIGTVALRLEPAALAARHPALALAQPRVLELHRDVVTELPPGAVHLAGSERTAHEMFALGETTLGLQGHPELDAQAIREAVEKLAEVGALLPGEQAAALASLDSAPAPEAWRAWLQGFLY
ncbi:MAG TPA: type 1 glutamine amidotransferase, partial [bacterium]|nr:type 1 glutamine amidotransferase [bacterium]